MSETMLNVQNVDVRYGAVPAIRDLTMNVNKGEIVALLGANGAGKTTTLRMISGLHPPFAGTVELEGQNINNTPAHDLVFDHIFTLFPVLGERRKQAGGTLSGGEQQMLAIGRALMAKPRLLLLDEPSLGLAPKIITSIFEIITQIRSEGVTILLVEQNANQALRIADRGYVLENGHVLYEDTAPALLSDDRIRRAYLGQ